MAKGEGQRAKGNKLVAKSKKLNIAASFAFCLLPLALCLILSSGCTNKLEPGATSVNRPKVEGVTISTVHPAEVEKYFETSGTVKAKTISEIASRMIGTITSLRVREGDHVRAGQLLMTIDSRDVKQKVLAAEKAMEAGQQNKSLADVTYTRYKELYDEKALTRQEMDQMEAQKKIADLDYERAKAMLAEARVNLSFSNIVSPVSGVITEKKTERGAMAVPGNPLLVVEDTSSYQVEVHPDETVLGKMTTGMPVQVVIDSIGRELEGKVVEIIPSVDPMSHTFTAKIAVAGAFLKTGMYAKTRVPAGRKKVMLLPDSSIIEKGQLTGVYAVDEREIVTYRLVRTGMHYGNNIEILSGINPGERVIVGGAARAVDGGIVSEAGK